MGPDAMILGFWVLSQFFHSPLWSLSRGSLVPPHFLPLKWYYLYIWRNICWYFSQLVIAACDSPSPAFCVMYSFPNFEPVCCSMSGSNCSFLTCIKVSWETGKIVWYPISLRNVHNLLWSTKSKREGICIYLWQIHVDVWQKPTQYWKAIILQLKISKLFKKENGKRFLNFLQKWISKMPVNIWKDVQFYQSSQKWKLQVCGDLITYLPWWWKGK